MKEFKLMTDAELESFDIKTIEKDVNKLAEYYNEVNARKSKKIQELIDSKASQVQIDTLEKELKEKS